ncbi:MAG: hypothetical protein MJ156_00830 [Alphaproteobacteria bacterium]|nr:hypothetical protein [Alphaproteobacteria bacterium]
MYLKGGFGWQPGEMFALNLYGQVSLYDSAKDKKLGYYSYYNSLGIDTDDDGNADVAIPAYEYGDYKIKNYNEWKVGLQGILYF